MRVHVIADREVVTEVLDVTAISGTIPEQLAHSEARRQNPAAPSGAYVLEDERQPHHRYVADVQHRRTRDHDVFCDHLDLVGPEVVIGNRVVAAGDGTAADVERSLTTARGVAHERRIL